MKIINWWFDRYSIGGLFIVSILCGLMTVVMACHIFFDFSLSDKLGKLSLEYKNGIAVPVTFRSSPGGDTSIEIRERYGDKNTSYTIFRSNNKGQWDAVEGSFQSSLSSDKIYYRDTIFPAYQTMNSRPPWKYNWSNVTKVDFEKGTVYIKPNSFYNRGLLLAPQVLFFILLSFFTWQLAFFLDNIQRGEMFTQSNYKRLRNMGSAILIYQALLLAIYFFENSYYVLINYRATIPNFRFPVQLMAEADYHLGWSYILTGCIILIVAKAFHKGYTLQNEQDLTI